MAGSPSRSAVGPLDRSDLIVATRNGTPISQENQRRSLATLCERARVDPITPYELRHTALTQQVEAGHGVSNVADWAGTSEKMIFGHYRHKLRAVSGLKPSRAEAVVSELRATLDQSRLELTPVTTWGRAVVGLGFGLIESGLGSRSDSLLLSLRTRSRRQVCTDGIVGTNLGHHEGLPCETDTAGSISFE